MRTVNSLQPEHKHNNCGSALVLEFKLPAGNEKNEITTHQQQNELVKKSAKAHSWPSKEIRDTANESFLA